jgi:hypothetical protein
MVLVLILVLNKLAKPSILLSSWFGYRWVMLASTNDLFDFWGR